jgi:hypothetical protein
LLKRLENTISEVFRKNVQNQLIELDRKEINSDQLGFLNSVACGQDIYTPSKL